jgi:hypothetical protein
MNLKNLLFASVIVLSANASFAQDTKVATHLVTISIPEVALLDLEFTPSEFTTSTAITLAGTAPTEAGLPMTFENATNSSIWMNYSSIVKGVALTRNVSVAITNGAVPTGLKLTVLASAPSSGGKGTLGTASTALILSGTKQDIVTGIGSTYTGNGPSNGHNLTYKLDYLANEADNYAALRFIDTAAAPLTITYTLSDSL